MSGGFWEYKQYGLGQVTDDIKEMIEKSGKEKSPEELKDSGYGDSWYGFDYVSWYERFPEEKFHPTYPEEVLEEMKNAIKYLTKARIYMHRLDWLLSGDDGEESFLYRLKEELEEAEAGFENKLK
jgi:hypothetical protein